MQKSLHGSVGVSSVDVGIMDHGGAALVTGGAVALDSAASTTLAISAIQPDIELEDKGGGVRIPFRRGCWKG